MSAIAERLMELRGNEAQGLFAAKLGLKQAVYCHYEKGRREPSLDTLIHMALVLNTSTDYLLGISDQQPPSAPPGVIKTGDNSPVITGNGNSVSYSQTPRTRKSK